jgi:hypothetical protein
MAASEAPEGSTGGPRSMTRPAPATLTGVRSPVAQGAAIRVAGLLIPAPQERPPESPSFCDPRTVVRHLTRRPQPV